MIVAGKKKRGEKKGIHTPQKIIVVFFRFPKTIGHLFKKNMTISRGCFWICWVTALVSSLPIVVHGFSPKATLTTTATRRSPQRLAPSTTCTASSSSSSSSTALGMCICIDCARVTNCAAYHFVETKHEQPHINENPTFEPIDGRCVKKKDGIVWDMESSRFVGYRRLRYHNGMMCILEFRTCCFLLFGHIHVTLLVRPPLHDSLSFDTFHVMG